MSDPISTPSAILATANQLQQNGRVDEALDTLTEATRSGVRSTEIQYLHAQLLIAKGRIAEAVTDLEEVARSCPAHTWALNDLGVIHHQQGKPVKAIEYFRSALDAGHNNPNALGNLLSVLAITGRVDEGLELARTMRERHNSDKQIQEVVSKFEAQCATSKPKKASSDFLVPENNASVTAHAGRLPSKEFPTINVVYDGLLPEHAQRLHRGGLSVIWSSVPLEGCDVYAYLNGNSYRGPQGGLSALLLLEPMVVLPGAYTEEVWKNFDYVLTMCDSLAQQAGKFVKISFPRSDWEMEWDTTEEMQKRDEKYPIDGRKKSICMINGNKASLMSGELYSKRVEIAQWFHKKSSIPFDVFGKPAFPLPNYRGALPHGGKLDTLRQYKYSLCFENTNDPVFSAGYVSEKILDCLETRTLPIYLGAANIEHYIPGKCFIDFRQFHSYEELDAFLQAMTDDRYRQYISEIDQWVCAGGLRPYSWFNLYDLLASIYSERTSQSIESLFSASTKWTDGLSRGVRHRPWPEMKANRYWTWDELARAPQQENQENFVHPTAQLERQRLVKLGKHSEIHDYVIIRTYDNPVVIGEYTQVNPFTVIYGGSGVYIGNNVMIAPHCMIAAGNHDHVQIETPIRFAGNITRGPIIIEDNVWIGANCTIADGVRIGRDAVISANSLVTKDVAPYDIVRGIPAKPIGNRLENAKKNTAQQERSEKVSG